MRIAVLAANGRTGQELTRQALARGHHVTAIARRPSSPAAPNLTPFAADVTDPVALRAALADADAVVSGLGLVKGSPADLLTTAARALVQALSTLSSGVADLASTPGGADLPGQDLPDPAAAGGPQRADGGLVAERGSYPTTRPQMVWLGAFGTGRSTTGTGPATRLLLQLALGDEIPDKVAADELLLAAGATIVHAGPLTNGSLREGSRVIDLNDLTRRRLPRPVSRASVAAAMLDAAEQAPEGGRILLV